MLDTNFEYKKKKEKHNMPGCTFGNLLWQVSNIFVILFQSQMENNYTKRVLQTMQGTKTVLSMILIIWVVFF